MANGRNFGQIEYRRWGISKRKYRLTPEEKAVLIEFLAGQFGSSSGFCHIPVLIPCIAEAAGLSEDVAEKTLNSLQGKGLLFLDRKASVVWVPEVWEHKDLASHTNRVRVELLVRNLPPSTVLGPMLGYFESRAALGWLELGGKEPKVSKHGDQEGEGPCCDGVARVIREQMDALSDTPSDAPSDTPYDTNRSRIGIKSRGTHIGEGERGGTYPPRQTRELETQPQRPSL